MTAREMPTAGSAVDVLVVGAGPAGAMAAYGLARLGVEVLLVERSAFPRSKVCGCCVNARALTLLADHGLRERVEALQPYWYSTLRVTAGGARAEFQLPAGASIPRAALDDALVQAAVAAGARFQDRTTASFAPRSASERHHVTLTTEGERPIAISCRVLIAADGLGGAIARTVAGQEAVASSSRIGAGAVTDDPPLPGLAEHCVNMLVGRDGYVGIVRLPDGRWNIAAALDPYAVKHARDVGRVVNSLVGDAGFPSSRQFADTTWRGTVPLTRCPSRVASERSFLIGDAAGYVEPFTGDGIASALESGALVVPFARGALGHRNPDAATQWARALAMHRARQRRLTAIAAWTLRRPALARRVLRVMARVPSLATPVLDLMHRSMKIESGAVT